METRDTKSTFPGGTLGVQILLSPGVPAPGVHGGEVWPGAQGAPLDARMPGEAPSGPWSSPCVPHLVTNRRSLGQAATLSAGAACPLTPSHPSSDRSCCPSSTLRIQPPRPWSRTEELAQYGRGEPFRLSVLTIPVTASLVQASPMGSVQFS